MNKFLGYVLSKKKILVRYVFILWAMGELARSPSYA